MADIYCRKCGEPWDIYSVTDEAKDLGVSTKRAHELFRQYGCGFFDEVWNYDKRPTIRDMRVCSASAQRDMTEYSALADLLGDDVDGLAALAEDFGL